MSRCDSTSFAQVPGEVILRLDCLWCSKLYDLIDYEIGYHAKDRTWYRTFSQLSNKLGWDTKTVKKHVGRHLEPYGLVTVDRPGGRASPRVRLAYNPARGVHRGKSNLPKKPERRPKKPMPEIGEGQPVAGPEPPRDDRGRFVRSEEGTS